LGFRTRTLNSDGTVSNVSSPFGLDGIPARRAYGGVDKIPLWFQQRYSTGPYIVGFGGYASRMSLGPVSLGLTAYTMPEPSTVPSTGIFPTSTFKIMSDHSGGTFGDWYSLGAPTTFDRGHRNSDVLNYFDGGDPRQNPSTPPTAPVSASGQWQSPAPDGIGRFSWDSFNGAAKWVRTSTKEGFVAVPTLGCGKMYYMTSAGHIDRRCFDLQIFNPADFGAVIEGKKKDWQVQPESMQTINLPGLTGIGSIPINITGIVFDDKTNRLYLYGPWAEVNGTIEGRIYVYQVN
jgi:hypothetical protein